MKLTILERVEACNLLPVAGDILMLRMRQEMIGKIGLSEQEWKKYKVVQHPDGRITWDPNISQETDIKLTDIETNILREALEKRNHEKTLSPNHLTLYDKFVK